MIETPFPIVITQNQVLLNHLLLKPNTMPFRVSLNDLIVINRLTLKQELIIPLNYASLGGIDWLEDGPESMGTTFTCSFLTIRCDNQIYEYARQYDTVEQEYEEARRRIVFSDVYVRSYSTEAEMLGMVAYLAAQGDLDKMKYMLPKINQSLHCDYRVHERSEINELLNGIGEFDAERNQS